MFFFKPALVDDFPQKSEWLKVSTSFQDLEFWLIFTRPLIFMSTRLKTNHLVTVTSGWILIGITVSFMFHSFFFFYSLGSYLYLFSPLFSFTLWSAGTVIPPIGRFSFFGLTITRTGRLVEIRWSVCISKSQRILRVSFSMANSWLWIYYLFIGLNLNLLHNFQLTTFTVVSDLILFYANLLHSFIMWLNISSLSPHYLHLLFCCVSSILALT